MRRSLSKSWALAIGPERKAAVQALVVVQEALVSQLAQRSAHRTAGRTSEERRQHHGAELGHWAATDESNRRGHYPLGAHRLKYGKGCGRHGTELGSHAPPRLVLGETVRSAPWTVHRHMHPS